MGERDAVWKLKAVSSEILAIGHLLKWQQLEALQSEEVQAGVGEILQRLGRRVRRVADGLEDAPQKGRERPLR